jgi:hypothetical protein
VRGKYGIPARRLSPPDLSLPGFWSKNLSNDAHIQSSANSEVWSINARLRHPHRRFRFGTDLHQNLQLLNLQLIGNAPADEEGSGREWLRRRRAPDTERRVRFIPFSFAGAISGRCMAPVKRFCFRLLGNSPNWSWREQARNRHRVSAREPNPDGVPGHGLELGTRGQDSA